MTSRLAILCVVLLGVSSAVATHAHYKPLEDPADHELSKETCSCPVYETPAPIDCKGKPAPLRYAPPSACGCAKPPPFTCLPGTEGPCSCQDQPTPPEVDCRGNPAPLVRRMDVYNADGTHSDVRDHYVGTCNCAQAASLTCKAGTGAPAVSCPPAVTLPDIDCKGRPAPKAIAQPDEYGCTPTLPPKCISGTEGPATPGVCPVCVSYPTRYMDCKGRRRGHVVRSTDDCGCPLQGPIECSPGTDSCPTCPTNPIETSPEYNCNGAAPTAYQVLDNKCGCGGPGIPRCAAGTTSNPTCPPLDIANVPEINCLQRPLEHAIVLVNSGLPTCPHVPLAQCKGGTEVELVVSPLGCFCKVPSSSEEPIDCQGLAPPQPPSSNDACGCPTAPGPKCLPGTSSNPPLAGQTDCASNPILCYPYKCGSDDRCEAECTSDSRCVAPFVCRNGLCIDPATAGAPLGCFADPAVCGLYQCQGTNGQEGVCASSCSNDDDCASNAYCLLNQCVEGSPDEDENRCSSDISLCGRYSCGISRDVAPHPAFDFCRTSCSVDSHCAAGHYCDSPACVPGTPSGISCSGRGNCGKFACGNSRAIAPLEGDTCRTTCTEDDHCAWGHACSSNTCVKDNSPSNDPACQVPGSCPQEGENDGLNPYERCRQKYPNPRTAARKCKRAKIETFLKKAFRKFKKFLKRRGLGRPKSSPPPRRGCSCKFRTEKCHPYKCGQPGTPQNLLPDDAVCQVSCSADSHCASGYYCQNGECTPQGADGTECLSGRMCGTGLCQKSAEDTDGVCCNMDCAGTCRSCTLPGFLGQCQQVPVWQDLDGDCGVCRACGPIQLPPVPEGCAKLQYAAISSSTTASSTVVFPVNPYANAPEYEETDSGRSHPYRFRYSIRYDNHNADATYTVALGASHFVIHKGDRSVDLSTGGNFRPANALKTWTNVAVEVRPVDDEDSNMAEVTITVDGFPRVYTTNNYPNIDTVSQITFTGGAPGVGLDSLIIQIEDDLEWVTTYRQDFEGPVPEAILGPSMTFTPGSQPDSSWHQEGECQPTPSGDTDRCAPLPAGLDPNNDCGPFGTCNGHGGCRCADDDVSGHWAGETCNECKMGWDGEDCKTPLLTVPIQYASDVLGFSSEVSETSFGASSILGSPDVFPAHQGDQKAWQATQSGNQFIDVRFSRPVFPDGLFVYESFNPGSIVKISTRNVTAEGGQSLPGDATVTTRYPRYGAVLLGRFNKFYRFPTDQFIEVPSGRVRVESQLPVSQFTGTISLDQREAVENSRVELRYYVDGVRVGYAIATGGNVDSLTLTSVAISRGWRKIGNRIYVPRAIPTFTVDNSAAVDANGVITVTQGTSAAGPVRLFGDGQPLGTILQVQADDSVALTTYGQSSGWVLESGEGVTVARHPDVALLITEQVSFRPIDTIRIPGSEAGTVVGGSRADQVIQGRAWERKIRVKRPFAGQNPRRNKEAYIKFDISSVDDSLAFDKAEIILTRKVTRGCQEGSVTNNVVTLVNNDWSALTLTFNNRPTGDLNTLATLPVRHGRGGAFIVDVSNIVRTRPTGDQISIRIVGEESNCVTKYFSVGAHRPERRPVLQILPPNDNEEENPEPPAGCSQGPVASFEIPAGVSASVGLPAPAEEPGTEADNFQLSYSVLPAPPQEGLATGAGIDAETTPTLAGPFAGVALFRPFRGKVCQTITYSFPFPSDQTDQIHVQLTISHRNLPNTTLASGVVVWAETITANNFIACVQERSRDNGTPDETHLGEMAVEYVAYIGMHRLPEGSRGEIRVPQAFQPDIGHTTSVRLMEVHGEQFDINQYRTLADDPSRFDFPAWVNIHCEDIVFPTEFAAIPLVFVTANHRTATPDITIDAVQTWIEVITTKGFRVCMKELASEDQRHNGHMHIDYLAIVDPNGTPATPTPTATAAPTGSVSTPTPTAAPTGSGSTPTPTAATPPPGSGTPTPTAAPTGSGATPTPTAATPPPGSATATPAPTGSGATPTPTAATPPPGSATATPAPTGSGATPTPTAATPPPGSGARRMRVRVLQDDTVAAADGVNARNLQTGRVTLSPIAGGRSCQRVTFTQAFDSAPLVQISALHINPETAPSPSPTPSATAAPTGSGATPTPTAATPPPGSATATPAPTGSGATPTPTAATPPPGSATATPAPTGSGATPTPTAATPPPGSATATPAPTGSGATPTPTAATPPPGSATATPAPTGSGATPTPTAATPPPGSGARRMRMMEESAGFSAPHDPVIAWVHDVSETGCLVCLQEQLGFDGSHLDPVSVDFLAHRQDFFRANPVGPEAFEVEHVSSGNIRSLGETIGTWSSNNPMQRVTIDFAREDQECFTRTVALDNVVVQKGVVCSGLDKLKGCKLKVRQGDSFDSVELSLKRRSAEETAPVISEPFDVPPANAVISDGGSINIITLPENQQGTCGEGEAIEYITLWERNSIFPEILENPTARAFTPPIAQLDRPINTLRIEINAGFNPLPNQLDAVGLVGSIYSRDESAAAGFTQVTGVVGTSNFFGDGSRLPAAAACPGLINVPAYPAGTPPGEITEPVQTTSVPCNGNGACGVSGCQCFGNHAGTACELCAFGFSGPDCETDYKDVEQEVCAITLIDDTAQYSDDQLLNRYAFTQPTIIESPVINYKHYGRSVMSPIFSLPSHTHVKLSVGIIVVDVSTTDYSGVWLHLATDQEGTNKRVVWTKHYQGFSGANMVGDLPGDVMENIELKIEWPYPTLVATLSSWAQDIEGETDQITITTMQIEACTFPSLE